MAGFAICSYNEKQNKLDFYHGVPQACHGKTHTVVLNLVIRNAGNRILGLWNFKIFWGSMPPDPPWGTGLVASCRYSQVLYANLLATSVIIETPGLSLLYMVNTQGDPNTIYCLWSCQFYSDGFLIQLYESTAMVLACSFVFSFQSLIYRHKRRNLTWATLTLQNVFGSFDTFYNPLQALNLGKAACLLLNKLQL